MEMTATRFDHDLLATAAIGNAGLALDRYLAPDAYLAPGVRDHLINRVIEQSVPQVYEAAFGRWQAMLHLLPHVTLRRLRARGRMIVGIGAASVHETNITLHRAYGTPLIPGAALKGLARHFSQRAIVAGAAVGTSHPLADTGGTGEPNAYSVLFGHQHSGACVRYLDAWYVPGSAARNQPLHRDVITVHHQAYYGSQGRKQAPWDFDDPVPVPFLSASGDYLLAVQGPNAAWSEFAAELLTHACEQWGVGAKTASGYGRLVWPDRPQPRTPHSLLRELERLRPHEIKPQLAGKIDRWRTIEDAPDRREVARAIHHLVDSMPRKQRWAAEPSYLREVRDYLAATEGTTD